jgi:hypothetical protein
MEFVGRGRYLDWLEEDYADVARTGEGRFVLE